MDEPQVKVSIRVEDFLEGPPPPSRLRRLTAIAAGVLAGAAVAVLLALMWEYPVQAAASLIAAGVGSLAALVGRAVHDAVLGRR